MKSEEMSNILEFDEKQGWVWRISGSELPYDRGIFCPKCGEPISTMTQIDDEVRSDG